MIKVLIVAAALSSVSIGTLSGFINSAQAAEDKAPSWQALCGYQWRQHKATSGESGRDAHTAFMRLSKEQGGCGAKAARGAADDQIKSYLESHPGTFGPKTEAGPQDVDGNGSVIVEARFKKR